MTEIETWSKSSRWPSCTEFTRSLTSKGTSGGGVGCCLISVRLQGICVPTPLTESFFTDERLDATVRLFTGTMSWEQCNREMDTSL